MARHHNKKRNIYTTLVDFIVNLEVRSYMLYIMCFCSFVVSQCLAHRSVGKGRMGTQRKKTPMPLRHFRSLLFAELIHCVLSSGTHRQALNLKNKKIKYLYI